MLKRMIMSIVDAGAWKLVSSKLLRGRSIETNLLVGDLATHRK